MYFPYKTRWRSSVMIILVILICLCPISCESRTDVTGEATSEAETSQKTQEEITPAYRALMPVIVAKLNWPHRDAVLDRLGDMIKNDTGIEVTFIPVDLLNAFNDTMNRLYAGTSFDIAFTDDERCNVSELYKNGFLLDLMDVREELDGAMAVIGPEMVEASMKDGRLLSLPCLRFRGDAFGFVMRKDLLEEAGYSEFDLISGDLDQLSEIFSRVYYAHPDMRMIDEDGAYFLDHDDIFAMNQKHTDTLEDGFGVLDHYGQTWSVTNYYESDFFREAVSYLQDWGRSGYMKTPMKPDYDPYVSFSDKVKSGAVFGGFRHISPETASVISEECSREMVVFPVTKYMLQRTYGRGYGIPKTSKDPVMAARLLNYIFCSASYNDTLNWGVEGLDWTAADEDTAVFPEGVTKENSGWHNDLGYLYPNQRTGHVFYGNDPEVFSRLWPDAERKAMKSLAYDFYFEAKGLEDIRSALENIRFSYLFSFSGLMTDQDAMQRAEDLNKELYEAGLTEYMAEKQGRLDEWRKKNDKLSDKPAGE